MSAIKLPGLNRGAMSDSSIALCELAVKGEWDKYLDPFDRSRVGLYVACSDSYDFDPAVYGEWSPGQNIRKHLRGKVPPTALLKRGAGMTAGCLSILLRVSGPVYSFPHLPTARASCEQWSRLDFSSDRIDLALVAWTVQKSNLIEAGPDSLLGCELFAIERPV